MHRVQASVQSECLTTHTSSSGDLQWSTYPFPLGGRRLLFQEEFRDALLCPWANKKEWMFLSAALILATAVAFSNGEPGREQRRGH